ncbi:MAG: hypothetical protein MUC95_03395 [Spirochaetes bacterium]|nr:hypothetical protein [Spirochaetota bacterium]
MKKISSFIGIALIVLCFFGSFACSSNENGKFAAITINTGLQNDKALTKAAGPRNITDILLTVTAEGMTTIEKIIPVETGEVTVDVPAGSERTFTVRANTNIKTTYYEGTAVEDIQADVPKTVIINMAIEPAHVTFYITNPVNLPVTSYTVIQNNTVLSGINSISTPVDLTPGTGQTITLMANIDQSDPTATSVKSFSGTVTNYVLFSGDNNPVSIRMTVNETNIVIPDYYNNRLVQIYDLSTETGTGSSLLSGTGAVVLSSVSLEGDPEPIEVTLYPYDVEFDAKGRIYIANNIYYGDGEYGGIIRVDNMSGVNPVQIVYMSNVGTIYYDPVATAGLNYLYYATTEWSPVIYRISINETTGALGEVEESIDLSTVLGSLVVTGLSVNNGNVYATFNQDGPAGIIWFNFDNPPTVGVPASYKLFTAPSSYFNDIIVKSAHIYVASSYSVMEFIDSAESITSTGVTLNSAHISGTEMTTYFFGPQRFAATLNRRFYVMDEYNYGDPGDRIVSFSDLLNYDTGGIWDIFDDLVDETAFQFFFPYGMIN